MTTNGISDCVVLEFNATGDFYPSYPEGGMTVTSLYSSSSAHVHLAGDSVRNHGGCCSTPYRFTSDDGSPFNVVAASLVNVSARQVFTAGEIAIEVTNDQVISFNQNYFSNIESMEWAADGNAYMEWIEFCPATTPPSGGGSSNGRSCGGDTAADTLGHINFTFDREAATSAAVSLADSYDPEAVRGVTQGLPFYSGFFMSLALRAGNLPMATGWHASLNGTGNNRVLSVSDPWKSHSYGRETDPHLDGALIGYIWGSRASGLPRSNEFSFAYGGGSNGDVMSESVLINDDDTFNFAALNDLNTTYTWLSQYKPGDYLYLDSTFTDNMDNENFVPHGLMIVGYEEPIRCNNDSLAKVRFAGCHQGDCSDTIELQNGAQRIRGTNGVTNVVQVPYVVDWNRGLQTQSPRPFYCTASRAAQQPSGLPGFFTHDHWIFYRVPESGWVLDSIYRSPNFEVTPQGHIRACP